jgi:hypothetical protein
MFMVVEKGALPLRELSLEDLREILQHLVEGFNLVAGGLQLEPQTADGGGGVVLRAGSRVGCRWRLMAPGLGWSFGDSLQVE